MGKGGALHAPSLPSKARLDKAADAIDYQKLSDLLPPSTATDDFDTCFGLDDADLEAALWEDAATNPTYNHSNNAFSFPSPPASDFRPNPALAAFGNCSVDALFAGFGSSPLRSAPGSPSSWLPSLPSSPPRDPRLGPAAFMPVPTTTAAARTAFPEIPTPPRTASPALAAPTPAAPAIALPLSRPILTSYASADNVDVRIVCAPRVPKRPAEEEPAAPNEASEDSDASALTLNEEDITMAPCEAVLLNSPAEVLAALADMPTQQQTRDGEIVTLTPTIWRTSPPFRIHLNARLHTMRAAVAEAPATLFSAINPRVITTGQPNRRLCRAHAYRRIELAAPPLTRASRHAAERADSAPAAVTEVAVRREKTGERETCTLQEVWLLKRSTRRANAGQVLETHRCGGPFDGTTMPVTPAWTGDFFAIDVVAMVAEPSGGSFWLKACNRNVQDLSPDAAAAN